jgi:hypothetical protein
MSDESMTAVLAGRVDEVDGQGRELSWLILASGDELHFRTTLEVWAGSRRVAASGMAGPKLYPGSPISEWRGRTDDLPYFVMARVSPEVDRVVAVTDLGTEVELKLSPPIPEFGLRFAAAALPVGEAPGRIRTESNGLELTDDARPMVLRPPLH